MRKPPAHSNGNAAQAGKGGDEGVAREVKPVRISIKGRGAADRPQGRFETIGREAVDDGWSHHPAADGEAAGDDAASAKPRTEVAIETAKSIISRNQSPDLPFSQSVNPYRGCEHGCIYCYARPTHAYLGLSPGLDFETRLFAKTNAAQLLRKELAAPGYRCQLIALGTNTDPYQPIERELKIARGVIEVLAECDHPLGIVTKSAMVERDIDLLAPMAKKGLVQVFISIATLDHDMARKLEPRASAPARRLQAIERLSGAGIPVGVFASPVIPLITDQDIESVLEAASAAGASRASYTMLRLPNEVNALFQDWLQRHFPLRAEHVMSQVRQLRGGRDNDPQFGTRMTGQGIFATLIRQRFQVAARRLGFDLGERNRLDVTQFRAPSAPPVASPARASTKRGNSPQLDLF